MINAVQIVTPLDENGQKDGEEGFYTIYGNDLLHSVSYKAGVRDGPEKTLPPPASSRRR